MWFDLQENTFNTEIVLLPVALKLKKIKYSRELNESR